jgi:hypothetical protein
VDAGHVPDAAVAVALALDCRPRVSEVGRFEPSCQYVGGSLPIVACRQSAPGTGALRLTVLHPERVVVGQPAAIGGPDPVVKVDLAATIGNLLVQTLGGGSTGSVVFDRFELGHAIHGSFVETAIGVGPEPAFTCRLSPDAFSATSGPGVTAP